MTPLAAWLALELVRARCITSDHVLDALVCALVAIAAKAGATHMPSEDQRQAALIKGLDPRTVDDGGSDRATGGGMSEGRPRPERAWPTNVGRQNTRQLPWTERPRCSRVAPVRALINFRETGSDQLRRDRPHLDLRIPLDGCTTHRCATMAAGLGHLVDSSASPARDQTATARASATIATNA